MVNVEVLRTLGDVVAWCEKPEDHPAFRIFWNECGTIARVEYVLGNWGSHLRQAVAGEVAEIERKAAASKSPDSWVDYVAVCQRFRAAEVANAEPDADLRQPAGRGAGGDA